MPCDTAREVYRRQKAAVPTKRVVLAPKQAFRLAAEKVTRERRPGFTITGVWMDSEDTIVVDGIYDPNGYGRDQNGKRPRRLEGFRTEELHELAHTFMPGGEKPPAVKAMKAETDAERIVRLKLSKELPLAEDERIEIRHVRHGVQEDTVEFEYFAEERVIVKLTPEQLAYKREVAEVEEEQMALGKPVAPKGPQEYVMPDGTKAIQMPDGSLYVK